MVPVGKLPLPYPTASNQNSSAGLLRALLKQQHEVAAQGGQVPGQSHKELGSEDELMQRPQYFPMLF